MGERKRIGILTSGGDCAGLNAVIRLWCIVLNLWGRCLEFVKQPLVDDSTPQVPWKSKRLIHCLQAAQWEPPIKATRLSNAQWHPI